MTVAPKKLTLRVVGAMIAGLTLIATPSFAQAATTSSTRSTVAVVDIANARAQALGSVVTVRGGVTVQSGAFSSSTFDQGFAVQDRTGGIYVSVAADSGLKLGDRVKVTGVLQESSGLLILVPAAATDVAKVGTRPQVAGKPVTTGSVNESTEGRLVTVKGTVSQAVSSDLPYGYKFYVNDGSGEIQVFVSASTNLDLSGVTLGQRIKVTGFSGQFETTYEVQPRRQSDLHH